jgi:hypothetical protein
MLMLGVSTGTSADADITGDRAKILASQLDFWSSQKHLLIDGYRCEKPTLGNLITY